MFLYLVECLDSCSTLKFEVEQRLVAIVNVLHKLFVLNLQLVKVNELEVVAHLVFVLDLGLGLEDLALEGVVFALQLVNELVLLLELVVNVL